MKNQFVLSIDVEDWSQVENLKPVIDKKSWEQLESRVEQNTLSVLEVLQTKKIKGTFFALGWIAERFPDIIKEITAQGHEIGSHGYFHDLLHNLNEEEIKKDIEKSLEILTLLSKNAIIGYRAPSFSINPRAIKILKKLHFRYEASYNDFQFNQRYGNIEVPTDNHRGFFISTTVWQSSQ